jgi:hypothetical protein
MEAEEEVDAAEAELGRRAEASIANYVHGLPEAAAELLRAVQSSDVGVVRRLASTPEGRAALVGGKPPPLVLAASNGDDAIVAALVELGAPLAGCGASGLTALHAAASAGDERTVATLLTLADHAAAGGRLVDATALGGVTALHCAVKAGHVAVARLLLVHGADPNVASSGGTPLHAAVGFEGSEAESLALARELLDNRAAASSPACVWTRVFCYSSFSFGVPIGILHINDNWGVE